jgi:AcrR family transcriptional regulator
VARPAGARNKDFDERRAALARALWDALVALGPGASLRDLAAHVDATPRTLKHYFGDRAGTFAAAAGDMRARGRAFMDLGAVPMGTDARASLITSVQMLTGAWVQFGVGRAQAVGLGEGLVAEDRGPVYVAELLEPVVDTYERLIAALMERGDLPPVQDLRVAALALIGPVFVALLHQDTLGGVRCRPLDLDAFVPAHVDGWLRGYGPSGQPVHGNGGV